MTKDRIKLLERIFEREINGTLPFQSAAALMNVMHTEGLVAPMEKWLPEPFPMKLVGWQLTEAGRYAYCQTCQSDGTKP